MKFEIRELLLDSIITFAILLTLTASVYSQPRRTGLFDKACHPKLDDVKDGQNSSLEDSQWRLLDPPHDRSIEGHFTLETKEGGATELHIVKGERKFREGDNLLCKSPDFDDSSW